MRVYIDEAGIQKPLTREELSSIPSDQKVYAPWSREPSYWAWRVSDACRYGSDLYFYKTKEEAIGACKYYFNIVHK